MADAHSRDLYEGAAGVDGESQPLLGAVPTQPPNGSRPALHRISEVRQREGVSLRAISRRWKVGISKLRELEEESTDLTLSQLYRWQEVLEVPVAELLVDADQPFATPVLRRAQMIRLMKTAATLAHKTRNAQVQRLARMLMHQLVEIMPELDGLGTWPEVSPEH
ncbi:MAG: hypothetical protein GTO03_17870 [Planctomycetales bacterium]|nr:hypothetical protein [Planctomycetales bacterium]